MFFMTTSSFCFTFLNILVQIQSLPESHVVDSYDIVVTELAIRNTVNKLFSTLKLKNVKQNLKLKQHSTVHNFFVSVTLKDHDNLKKIARLTKVDDIDNGTRVFITQLNEVLNEDYKSDEKTDVVYITILIEEFLKRLDGLKDIYGLKNNGSTFDINKDVLKHVTNDETVFGNTTKTGNDSNDDLVLSDSEYWEPSGRRIFEGTATKIERFPFMANVQFFKRFQCGGSIIKSDLVITSAACLQLAWNNHFFRENPTFLSVQVGNSFYESSIENIPILEIYFHPGYNPKDLMNNLAIMRMTRVLSFSKKILKVKKIDYDKNPWPLPSNINNIIIVGWGAKSPTNILRSSWKNKLSYALLDFYPLQDCQEIYSKEFVTDKNFCAGFFSKGSGACNHDSGGPGISNGVLIGVISFGSPLCGSPDAPTVFTKLGYYADWIKEIIEQKVPTAARLTTLATPFTYETTKRMLEATSHYKNQLIISEEINAREPLREMDDNFRTDDNLRMEDKVKIFKEFLATMFNSEEINDYIDQIKTEKQTNKDNSKKLLSKSKRKSKTKMSNSESKTRATTEKYSTVFDDYIEDKKHTKLISLDDSSPETATKIPFNKQRSVEEESSEDEQELLQGIKSLIDNIAINETFALSEESSFEKDRKKTKYKKITDQKVIHSKTKDKTTDQYQNSKLIEPKLNKPMTKNTSVNIDKLHHNFIKLTKNKLKDKNISEKSDTNDSENSEVSEIVKNIERDESNKNVNSNKRESIITEVGKKIGGNVKENNEQGRKENEANNRESENYSDTTSDDSNEKGKSYESEREGTEENKNDINDGNADSRSDEDEDYETLSIPKDQFKDVKANRNNNDDKLLQLLAGSEDVFDLISQAVQGKF